MDQERFDQLTKTLATGKSRRGLLKGLTGTAIGGLLAAVGIGEAAAKPDASCKAPRTKCGKGKNAVCCPSGQTCNANGTCGFTCPANSHLNGAGDACVPNATLSVTFPGYQNVIYDGTGLVPGSALTVQQYFANGDIETRNQGNADGDGNFHQATEYPCSGNMDLTLSGMAPAGPVSTTVAAGC